jgi:acetaldehyde dehydrogenase
MRKIRAAIIGSGNIGSDLMVKIMRCSGVLDMAAMVGVDPRSDGLRRAARLGIAAIDQGIDGLVAHPAWADIAIVFDATSASAHQRHSAIAIAAGKAIIDLTPAAIGPYVIPVVNGAAHLDASNVNMVTCGGQATIPIVAAIASVARVQYAEIVASIASASAGPGTRANIDEFTETTSRAIEQVGGAAHGKAIIILNPAEPPPLMRDTIFTLSSSAAQADIEAAIAAMVARVQAYVPGYRLKQRVQFETIPPEMVARMPGFGQDRGTAEPGLKTSVFLEVQGAAHYLPDYAGNLDIMTSAALTTGERMALHKMAEAA